VSSTSTATPLHGKDGNADGAIDFLYYKGSTSTVFFICSPTSTPYAGTLLSYGTASSWGMGFDATANALWAADNGTVKQFKVIQ
jgi:hypothetical protein